MAKIWKSKFIIISIIIVVLIALAVLDVVINLYQKPKEEIAKEFIIKTGEHTQEIASNLKKEGFIKSDSWFILYAKIKRQTIQAGIYQLSSSQGLIGIYDTVTGSQAKEYYVTIPEGWRVTQIDEYLSEKKVINAGELTLYASSDEGYLFPDTYRFLPDSEASQIRKDLINNFNKKTADLKPNRDTIILASIVEREAKFDEDRPKIAAVYLNRLEKQMKLEADPTVQYAKGSWDGIKVSDYRSVKSPYNTYLYAGLPPGPICNPGLKSIEAVLYPDKNDYLYFFHLKDGHAVYSNTLEEHQANLKKYQ